MELAHIALGHHIDTRYAFNDRLLFPDESTFQRIDMYHSDPDNVTAAKKAMEYLQASMYKDKLPDAGLFYEQLADRGRVLKALNSPKLGDSLLKTDGTPWMADLEHMAPKINWDDLTQTAALPLGSMLKTDPWDDKVLQLNAKRYAPMNARDKMPFEVTPIFYKLARYDVAAATPAAGAAAAAPDNTQQGAQPGNQPGNQPGAQPGNQTGPQPTAPADGGNAPAPPPQQAQQPAAAAQNPPQ
jgi:hypothetical protein